MPTRSGDVKHLITLLRAPSLTKAFSCCRFVQPKQRGISIPVKASRSPSPAQTVARLSSLSSEKIEKENRSSQVRLRGVPLAPRRAGLQRGEPVEPRGSASLRRGASAAGAVLRRELGAAPFVTPGIPPGLSLGAGAWTRRRCGGRGRALSPRLHPAAKCPLICLCGDAFVISFAFHLSYFPPPVDFSISLAFPLFCSF